MALRSTNPPEIDATDTTAVIEAFAVHDPKVRRNAEFRRVISTAAAEGKGSIAAYVRISEFDPDTERGSGDIGITRQAIDIARRAADDGYRIGTWHIDNDVSAASGKRRPAYDAAFALLSSGRATGLVAWDFVRLYRRSWDLEQLIKLCEESSEELQVFTVKTGSHGLDLTDPMGRQTARMYVWAGEMETHSQSTRQKASQRNRASKGLWAGGTVPFGYRRSTKPGHLAQEPAEAALVRRGAKFILDGGSLTSTARMFEESGIPPRHARLDGHSGRWRANTIRQMYHGYAIYGLRTHTPRKTRKVEPERGAVQEIVEAVWKPILEPKMRDAIIEAHAGNTSFAGDRTRRWWVGSHARCGVCGDAMGGQNTPRGGRYACRNGAHVTLSAHLLEPFARQLAIHSFEEVMRRPQVSGPQRTELERIDTERAELRAALANQTISAVGYAQAAEALDAIEHSIIASHRPPGGPKKSQTVADWWDGLSVPERSSRFGDLGLRIIVTSLGKGRRRTPENHGLVVEPIPENLHGAA